MLSQDVVYEEQNTDISWYNNEIPGGTAKNNHERIIALRKAFCHPLTINKDGTLNKKYFQNVSKETAQNWSDIELLQLYEGIYKHGIDSIEKWHKIQSDFLPQRDFIEVRIKLSQLFGVQNLSQYKDKKFESEKEVKDEFEKNKRDGIKNGTWNENCKLSLIPEIAKLTKEQERELTAKELKNWIENIYNNPHYVYRTNNKRTSNTNNNKNNKNKNNKNNKNNKKKPDKSQKNKIDQMLKKQAEKANVAEMEQKKQQKKKEEEEKQEVMETEKKEVTNNNNDNNNGEVDDQDEDMDIKIVEKPKPKPKPAKVAKKGKKKPEKVVPIIPDDSEDEDMLCVE